MKALAAIVCAAAALQSQSPSAGSPAEVENVVAFARLYGVVRWFHPSDAAAAIDWNRFAVIGVARVRAARDPEALRQALDALFTPLGPGIRIAASLGAPPAAGAPDPSLVAWRYLGVPPGPTGPPGPYRAERTNRAAPAAKERPAGAMQRPGEALPPPVAGASADVVLGRGLHARVPLALSDADAASRPDPARLDALLTAIAAVPDPAPPGADTLAADVVVAWNVFRHFYPYWKEVAKDTGVDWDARLPAHVAAALAAPATAGAGLDIVKRLVADTHDGHGFVVGSTPMRGVLPLQLARVEGRVMVTASEVAEIPTGSVLVSLDGTSIAERLDAAIARAAGAPQWREVRALGELVSCESGATVAVQLEAAAGPRTVEARCAQTSAPQARDRRPGPVAELRPGIWYVDLTRAKFDQVEPRLADLARAAGVVFDVRGYPTDAGARLLPYLLDEPEADRWMHVDHVTGPFGRVGGTSHHGWNMQPAAPRIAGRVVFLTDGRAISYAESVMGYVKDRTLGTIVGAPTAGTNGNVARIQLPGGSSVGYTGMRVTRHDGVSQHHLAGVQPDVPIAPTIAGVRAGRDELLEKAVELVSAQRP